MIPPNPTIPPDYRAQNIPAIPPVRTLAGPFTVEEDIAIFKDIEKTMQRNMRNTLIGVYAMLGVMVAIMPLIMIGTFGFSGHNLRSDVMIKWLVALIYCFIIVILLALDIRYRHPLVIRSVAKKYLKEWELDANLLTPPKPSLMIGMFDTYYSLLSVSPIHPESFMKHSLNKTKNGVLIFAVVLFGILTPMAVLMNGGSLLVAVRATIVTCITTFCFSYILQTARHVYAVRLSPKAWYWTRKAMMVVVAGLMFVFLGLIISAPFVMQTWQQDIDFITLNPFSRAVLFIPSALADVSVSDPVPITSVLVSTILWFLGVLSFFEFKKVDIAKTNVKLCLMERYDPKIAPSGVPGPVAFKEAKLEEKPKEKVIFKSQNVAWNSIDVGPGTDVLRSRTRLFEINYKPKYVVSAVVIILLCVFTLAPMSGGLLGDPFMDYLTTAMVSGMFLIFMTAATMAGAETNDSGVIFRLLPLELKKALWVLMEPGIKYGLGGYIVIEVVVWAVFNKVDPAAPIFVLLFIPLMYMAIMPLYLLSRTYNQGSGSVYSIIFVAAIFVIAGNLAFGMTMAALPAFVQVLVISIVPLGFIYLSWHIVDHEGYKRYLRVPRWKLRRKLVFAVCGMLILVGVMVPLWGTTTLGSPLVTKHIVARDVTSSEVISNGNYSFEGSITVSPGGNLKIINATITFKVVQTGKTGLYVSNSAYLDVYNSTITADKHFYLDLRGMAKIRNSTISRTWGSPGTGPGGGVQALSSGVELINTTIENGGGYGIYISDNNPTIRNCTIRNNLRSGIVVEGGAPLIFGSTVSGNFDGIHVITGSPTISRNLVHNNTRYGIYLGGTFANVHYNTVRDNKDLGMAIDDSDYRVPPDNIVYNNTGGNIGAPASTFNGGFMIVLLAPIFIIMGASMYITSKRTKAYRKMEFAAMRETQE
jgi:parallel beta-helix repeat protein